MYRTLMISTSELATDIDFFKFNGQLNEEVFVICYARSSPNLVIGS